MKQSEDKRKDRLFRIDFGVQYRHVACNDDVWSFMTSCFIGARLFYVINS